MQKITIATRKSPLALWQAEFVKQALLELHQDLEVVLLPLTTKGDKLLDSPLAKIGGKGLFVKELEQAMLDNQADIAVHSMKDVPMVLPDGLTLGPILAREDPRDAFISPHIKDLSKAPDDAIIGSSSLRRICQLKQHLPRLKVKSLRGNIHSRLDKLDRGEFDGIILAAAGLHRMNLQQRITQYLPIHFSLPACGQGALGIEYRSKDSDVAELIQPLNDPLSAQCVLAERALNTRLNGGCQVPIAGFAEITGNKVSMQALVGSVDGCKILRVQGSENASQVIDLGERLADELLAKGADHILKTIKLSH